ncbi:MAG: calcium-binding protein [Myxococcota bacterium]|nr:calcium-binding protein [Myxococcota bacterium]
MRILAATALALLTLAIGPGAALAGGGCEGMNVVAHIFDASDTDGSGTLSAAEYAEAGLERYGVPFSEYDANGDGEASLDEYLDTFDRYHAASEGVES